MKPDPSNEDDLLTLLHALLYLADHQGSVTVSQRDLATALGWNGPGRVRFCAWHLEDRGLIEIRRNEEPSERKSNTFTVTRAGREVAKGEEAA